MARLKTLTIEIHEGMAGKKPYVLIQGAGKGNNPEDTALEFKVWADEVIVSDFRSKTD
jgi:hypothetical protein